MHVFLTYCLLVSWLIHTTLCQNGSTVNDKMYVIHKVTVQTGRSGFYLNGVHCLTLPECSLQCIKNECSSWSYDDINNVCYMIPEYQEFSLKSTDGTDADYVWSTLYFGTTRFLINISEKTVESAIQGKIFRPLALKIKNSLY